jgi:hypothetical protein
MNQALTLTARFLRRHTQSAVSMNHEFFIKRRSCEGDFVCYSVFNDRSCRSHESSERSLNVFPEYRWSAKVLRGTAGVCIEKNVK